MAGKVGRSGNKLERNVHGLRVGGEEGPGTRGSRVVPTAGDPSGVAEVGGS